ncbi:MAG: SH3 domain-containing protein [Anaerolineales bacterium]
MKRLLLFAGLALLGTACTGERIQEATPSQAVASPSMTASFTQTPRAGTSPEPSPTVTLPAVEGITTTRLNVRAGPSTLQDSLGLLEAGQTVQVLGRDESGLWYAILFPAGPQGRGWVSAAYLQVAQAERLTVISLTTPTPTPAGPTARLTQRLNVRSGPATTYEVLGTLEAGSVVVLTGRNETGTWAQIEFASAPNGRGWVTAAYLQTDALAALPLVNASGTPITPLPDRPTPLAATLTPTLGPASADGDSLVRPAVQVTFAPGGVRQFTYTSDLSFPEGDLEDWLEFTPFASGPQALMYVSLNCEGNASLTVEFWREGAPLAASPALACGAYQLPVRLPAGAAVQIHLRIAETDSLRYCRYTLSLRNGP